MLRAGKIRKTEEVFKLKGQRGVTAKYEEESVLDPGHDWNTWWNLNCVSGLNARIVLMLI